MKHISRIKSERLSGYWLLHEYDEVREGVQYRLCLSVDMKTSDVIKDEIIFKLSNMKESQGWGKIHPIDVRSFDTKYSAD